MEGNDQAIDKTIRGWAILAIDEFQKALMSENIGTLDGDLMRSFMSEVKNNGGDGFEVVIRFLNYGRFVDMGVGRAAPLGSGGREPKKWFGKTKTREIAILRFLMASKYAIQSIRELETELKNIDKNAA